MIVAGASFDGLARRNPRAHGGVRGGQDHDPAARLPVWIRSSRGRFPSLDRSEWCFNSIISLRT